nr:polysaccharide pyruvyl transferase family protein [Pseudoalteromonas shioyasakiensis]
MIEIKGVQFVNKGAELMLASIISQLAKELPDADICLAHNKNSPYKSRAKVGAYQKINLRKNVIDLNAIFYFFPRFILNYFKKRFGIVTEADVDVVLDASGFSYGDQWSDVIIKQVANEVSRLKKKRKHYIFMPQSLGPFTRKSNKLSAEKAFSNASIVFAREEPSYHHVKSITPQLNSLKRAPDFTNVLLPQSMPEYAKYQGYLVVIPNSKMISSKNKNKWWHENYVSTIVKLVNKAADNKINAMILNHSGVDDLELCESIQAQLQHQCDIVNPQSALEVKAIIANAKLVFSSRFHGCVSSLSQGVPCIATGWSHKYTELFNEYNVGKYLLSPEVADESLFQILDNLIDEEEHLRSELSFKSQYFKKLTHNMWKDIFDVIKCK